MISCEGCEGTYFTPAGGAARYTSTRRFVLKSPKQADIQTDRKIMKDRFSNLSVDEIRTSKNENETNGNRK